MSDELTKQAQDAFRSLGGGREFSDVDEPIEVVVNGKRLLVACSTPHDFYTEWATPILRWLRGKSTIEGRDVERIESFMRASIAYGAHGAADHVLREQPHVSYLPDVEKSCFIFKQDNNGTMIFVVEL